jgi:hypothetical protein
LRIPHDRRKSFLQQILGQFPAAVTAEKISHEFRPCVLVKPVKVFGATTDIIGCVHVSL